MVDRLTLRLGTLAYAAILLTGATAAQAGPQEDAAAISKAIEGYLALVSDQSQAIGLSHDKITATPDGSGYAVAVTGMRLGSGQAGLDLGEIDYRLEPQSDGTYKVGDLTLAKEMPVIGEDGKPAGALSFETTAFSGVWSGALQSFLSLDWQAKDIVATALDPKATVQVAQASLTAEGKDAGNNRLDETVVYALTDVSATDPTGTPFKAAKVAGKMTLHAFDFVGYRTQMAKLHDLAQKYAANGGAPALSDADHAEIAAVAQALPKLVSGYDFTLSTDDAAGDIVSSGHVAHAEIGIALSGIDGDAASLQLHLKQDDLTIADPEVQTPLGQALFPKSLDLNLTFDQLPIASTTGNLAQAMAAGGPMAQDPATLFMMTMMSAVEAAPLSLKIAPSTLETARGRFAFDGNLASMNGSPFGKINVTATGLAEIVHAVEGALKDDPGSKEILDALHEVQAAAEHGTGADGKPADKILLEMAPSGQMTVNGKPMSGF
jgi:hypothetical protein